MTETILIQEASQMVEDCLKRVEKMTDWESKFMDSIKGRLAANYWLTEKQKETLGKIWDRVTEGG